MNGFRVASPYWGLLLVVALTGCAERDRLLALDSEGDAALTGDTEKTAGAGDGLGLGGARLRLSTTDPKQRYVGLSTDPWARFSWVTASGQFDLRVKNEGTRPARNLQLLVAVPGNLPEFGWSVTVGDPGVLLSAPSDFPHTLLADSKYPNIPRGIYGPRGDGRYALLIGPESLAPGETWTVPVQLYRGVTEGFKVHFDAAGDNYWNPPTLDVAAYPPVQEDVTASGAPR